MIAFFPDAYPDELLYSRICRYHVRSGNCCNSFTFDDIYGKRTVRPDPEFLNRFTEDALKWIIGDADLQTVIASNTMYPFYARFLPKDRRNKALASLLAQESVFYNHLGVPQTGERYLRYCPLCAAEDREGYGETYWHRLHQIQRIRVCPKHACYLENSGIRIASKTAPGFYDAESNVPQQMSAIMCENERELAFIRFVVNVAERPVDLETEFPIGIFLHRHLEGYYEGKSGLIVDIDRLYADYTAFYSGMEIANLVVFQKILNNYNHDCYFVLSIAFFLGVSADQISSLPKRVELTGIDRLYEDLANRHQLDFEIVSAIGKEVLRFSHNHSYIRRRSGIRSKEWGTLDEELLPQVQQEVLAIINAPGRPVKLSIRKIENKLKLPPKQIDQLTRCKGYIVGHMETQPEFWAREVEWLVPILQAEGSAITCTRINHALGLRTNDIRTCLPFIKDERVKRLIEDLLGD